MVIEVTRTYVGSIADRPTGHLTDRSTGHLADQPTAPIRRPFDDDT